MPIKIEQDGEEVEVYTAAEVQEREAAAAKAKDDEWTPKLADATTKLTDTEKRLQERTGEFNNFRKLNEEQVNKLSEAERVIYENGLRLKEAQDKNELSEKTNRETAVNNVIKSKAGTNTELEAKMKELWPLITVDATTPEQIEAKALMVLGAIQTQAPNLVAAVAGFTGSYAPPQSEEDKNKSFADTDRGRAGAALLGLHTEAPKAS